MPPQTVGEWSAPRMTGMKVIGGEESGYSAGGYSGGGGYSAGGYSGGGGYSGSVGSSPRKFDQSRLEVTDMSGLDPDVARQLESGLIDANDIADASGDFEDAPRQVYRRKVKKMVEVPVIRKVKVPCSTDRVVPAKTQQTIQVKKTIPVESTKTVEEAYTDIEERDATRMKEVWVKKMVPEQYKKRVEVRKTRNVQVPVTTYKEVTEDKVVEVDTTKVEQVPGWRLDEVKDTKMVEIEGWQEVELVPRLKTDGNVHIEKTYERQCPRRRVERKMGTEVIGEEDDRLERVDTDSSGDEAAEITSVGNVRLDGTEFRTRASKRVRRAPRAHRFLSTAPAPAPPAVAEKTGFTPVPPSSARESSEPPATPRGGNKMFGLRMNARKEGLLVSEVAPGGFAEDAGLQKNDTIVAVDGSSITSVKGWRTMLSQKAEGDFLTLVVKDASGKTRPAAVHLEGFNPAHYV